MKILLTLFVLLFSSSVFAEDIKGAFGQILGEVYKGELKIIGQLTSGEDVLNDIYGFNPENPSPTFSNYGLILTPKSKRIVEIRVWNKFDSSSKCESELEVIEVLLDKKYKNLKTDWIGFTIYTSNNKKINIRCTLFNNNLTLTYTDSEMEDLYNLEKSEEQSGKGF